MKNFIRKIIVYYKVYKEKNKHFDAQYNYICEICQKKFRDYPWPFLIYESFCYITCPVCRSNKKRKPNL